MSIFCTIILTTCLHQVSAEICNRVVAIVNDEVITLHELNKKIKEMTGLAPEDLRFQDENKYLETRRMVLELLIDDKIAQEKIRELGIKVTPQQVDEAIEKIKENNKWTHEDLMERLRKEGLTYERYRDKVKRNLERIKLINFEVKSKIIIREEEIRQYYENHIEEFSSEGEVHLAGIFLMRKDPEDADEINRLSKKGGGILVRLKNGEDFGELARKFSEGPGADEGGDLGVFKVAQLDPELGKALEVVAEGGFSDAIIRPNGIQIIKVIKREKREVNPFEEVRDAIYAILYQEEVNRRYISWIGELRENSYTKVIF